MAGQDPLFEAWADKARVLRVDEVCRRRYPDLKIRKSSEGFAGECPRCGGEDRFGINTKKNVWNCRHCDKGGDAIALVENAEGLSFVKAVEELTGEPPPGRERSEPTPMVEDDALREARAKERARQAEKELREKRQRAARTAIASELWDAGEPLRGTPAERYLVGRKIKLPRDRFDDMTQDLRYMHALEYMGFPEPKAEQEISLGVFPAMVAAIRNAAGDLIGVHRTYLNPRTNQKLEPPGDQRRNSAKKVLGTQVHGFIRLGTTTEAVALGEGIETTLSWWLMASAQELDCSAMAGVNLGNIAGKSLGRIPHPTLAKRTIPDGEPDMDHPGVILPPEVRQVYLLGDGDCDQPFARACFLTAKRRYERQGLEVFGSWAEAEKDFNDMLKDEEAA